jgi:hypothetical protein
LEVASWRPRFKTGPARREADVTELARLPHVSAGAKIPIVPVEFSPALDVVNQKPLHTATGIFHTELTRKTLHRAASPERPLCPAVEQVNRKSYPYLY